MKFENTQAWGFNHALRGMRNPLESWARGDSFFFAPDEEGHLECDHCPYLHIVCVEDEDVPECWNDGDIECWECDALGENDKNLAQRLIKSGPEHRKFMRQIFISVDITAPLYWWKEFDTYKVGTTANSTSTMHKLASKPITLECFEIDDLNDDLLFDEEADCDVRDNFLSYLDNLRVKYLETKDKKYWKELVRWLPNGWLQTRTVTMTYENVYSMIRQRRFHKLNEWSGKDDPTLPNFIQWAHTLPWSDALLFVGLEETSHEE